MEIKQRKKCGNCRAYSRSSKRCSIGYETEYIYMFGIVIDAKPLEPCPKPLTVNESVEAINFYTKPQQTLT